MRAVLLGGANRYRQPQRRAWKLARRRAPEFGLDHSGMVRRIHLRGIGCWRFEKYFPAGRSLRPVTDATSATSVSPYPLVSHLRGGYAPPAPGGRPAAPPHPQKAGATPAEKNVEHVLHAGLPGGRQAP